MRMIDADELKAVYIPSEIEGFEKMMVPVEVVLQNIDDMPTVDAVPVVRCRDCNWYQPDADKWCGYFECMGFEPNDYCSQGKRKDGDDG